MKLIQTSYPFMAYADTRQGGRSENQDTCSWEDTPSGLLITVCDGMGGGPAGKLASKLAAENITLFVKENTDMKDRCELLKNALAFANNIIRDRSMTDRTATGMGTTVTALLINEHSAIVAHVGDSRIYQFRKGKKYFRTWDHSLVFEKILDGTYKTEEEARLSDESNIILRALGIRDEVTVDVRELPYESGDRFLLCSDGIWGAFPEKEIISMAARTKVLSGAMESLIVRVDQEGAVNGGHHDNLTAAILETRNDSIFKEEMSTKQKNAMIALVAVCAVSILLNIILLIRHKQPTDNSAMIQESTIDSIVNSKMQESLKTIEKEKEELLKSLRKAQDNPAKFSEIIENEDNKAELKTELDDIIKELQLLKNEPKGSEKNQHVDSVQQVFKSFSQKAEHYIDKDQLNQVSEWLSQDMAKRGNDNNKAVGHYKLIIQKLYSIRNKM